MLGRCGASADKLGVVAILALLVAPASAAELPEFNCVIEPHHVIDLSTRLNGVVETLMVERGDIIARDQVLLALNADVEKAAAEQARDRAKAIAQVESGRVNLDFAERRLERVNSLYREQAISQDQKDQIETEARLAALELKRAREAQRQAQLELQRAEEYLKLHTIRSPIDGVVVERYLSPGESVEDKPIMRLAQIDPLRVEVIVPVAYFGEIRVGDVATVFPEIPVGGRLHATVSVVDRVADAASGTFRVRLMLPNMDYSVPSGLKCKVEIDSNGAAPSMTNAPTGPAPAARRNDTRQSGTLPGVSVAAAADASTPAAALTTPVAARTAVPTEPVCLSVGPIADLADVDRIRQAVAADADWVEVREKASADEHWYGVFSQRVESRAAAQALADEIAAAGFDQLFVVGAGDNQSRVSVGVFSKKGNADARVSALTEKGFEVEVSPVPSRSKSTWLDIGSIPAGAAADALSVRIAEMAPGARTVAVACDRLLAADGLE